MSEISKFNIRVRDRTKYTKIDENMYMMNFAINVAANSCSNRNISIRKEQF